MKTSIEWTDHSVNPLRLRDLVTGAVGHYCELTSAGCLHCYASNLQKRFQMPAFPPRKAKGLETLPIFDGEGRVVIGKRYRLFLDETKLHEVLKREKPTRYFWCDMTDLFGSWVPDEWLDRIFATMACSPQHTHQVLTKRPDRMAAYFEDLDDRAMQIGAAAGCLLDGAWVHGPGKKCRPTIERVISQSLGLEEDDAGFAQNSGPDLLPLPNVWLGTSVENKRTADERLPNLLRTPAAVRFVSYEPALGNVDWEALSDDCATPETSRRWIDWLIVGGESGAGARPLDVAWVASAVQQCQAAGVPCFVKQLGHQPVVDYYADDEWREWALSKRHEVLEPDGPNGYAVRRETDRYQPPPGTLISVRLADPKGGYPEDWPEALRVRQFPEVARC